MYGVVLWSDADDRQAVIWCEDHGDLAFVDKGGRDMEDCPGLAPGDLVCFELQIDSQIRKAINPSVVAEQEYPTLASALDTVAAAEPAGPIMAEPQMMAPPRDATAQIIPFRASGAMRRRNGRQDPAPRLTGTRS